TVFFRVILAGVFMAAVIAPWTLRNCLVLGAFIPISTNGGLAFYSANNPMASGGFTPRRERDLDTLMKDEVLWNRTGFELGKEWIRSHPMAFSKLIFQKQRIFLADDETGVFYTFSRWVSVDRDGGKYVLGRSLTYISNLWWFMLWIFVAGSLLRHRQFWRIN